MADSYVIRQGTERNTNPMFMEIMAKDLTELAKYASRCTPGSLGYLEDATVYRLGTQGTWVKVGDDFVSRFAAKANKEQEDWISPTLVNNWTAVSGFDTPGYFKDEFGFVSLRGLLNSGEGLTAAFTLPEGYRPAQTKYFPAASNLSLGIVRIELNGTVYIDTFTSWVSLESISFRV